MDHLEIKTIDIDSNLKTLLEEITRVRETPTMRSDDRQKFDNWIKNLDFITGQITKIDTVVLPTIEKDLGYPFSNKNHVFLALMRPSIKNTFKEIKDHFRNKPEFKISQEYLSFLENGPRTARTLAWIGDTTIKYGLLLKHWKPDISAQELHDMRKSAERNENFANLCRDWKLFDHRIHVDPFVEKKESTTEIKVKGTLTEALFGVIFIEKEKDGVQEAIHLIERS